MHHKVGLEERWVCVLLHGIAARLWSKLDLLQRPNFDNVFIQYKNVLYFSSDDYLFKLVPDSKNYKSSKHVDNFQHIQSVYWLYLFNKMPVFGAIWHVLCTRAVNPTTPNYLNRNKQLWIKKKSKQGFLITKIVRNLVLWLRIWNELASVLKDPHLCYVVLDLRMMYFYFLSLRKHA